MLILEGFDVGIDEQNIKSFCETYNLTNLMKQPTCEIETGLSDFHLMTLAVFTLSLHNIYVIINDQVFFM